MEIKQPFFVDPKQPGYVRGGFYDEMGGMLVGLRAGLVCKMLNEHPTLFSENTKLRKIAAHVPSRVYIKAKEAAGFADTVTAKTL